MHCQGCLGVEVLDDAGGAFDRVGIAEEAEVAAFGLGFKERGH
jgi:hypothetical protein